MPSFSLRVTSADTAKLIISVSKKVAKKAVTRNKIKRRVRAVFRNLISDLKPGSYLIIAKSGAESLKSKELESELKSLVVSRKL